MPLKSLDFHFVLWYEIVDWPYVNNVCERNERKAEKENVFVFRLTKSMRKRFFFFVQRILHRSFAQCFSLSYFPMKCFDARCGCCCRIRRSHRQRRCCPINSRLLAEGKQWVERCWFNHFISLYSFAIEFHFYSPSIFHIMYLCVAQKLCAIPMWDCCRTIAVHLSMAYTHNLCCITHQFYYYYFSSGA